MSFLNACNAEIIPIYHIYLYINDPFLAKNSHFIPPLKAPENQTFSGVFRGYKMGTFARNGLVQSINRSSNKNLIN